MNIVVWQWGRRGGGPRYAVELADGLRGRPNVAVSLCLSAQAEILRSIPPPRCDWQIPTYTSLPGLLARAACAPLLVARLVHRLRQIRPDIAICAMAGPLDLLMALALRITGTKLLVVVHDATPHPGDGLPGQAWLQRALLRRADALIALSAQVATALRADGFTVLVTEHPPRFVAVPLAPPLAHGGPFRLLCLGRLLPYKGLDLLADALTQLGPRDDLVLRIVGQGPETAILDRLRGLPGVTVENRWVPEDELDTLLTWTDGVVLPYREASQSGIAAAALAAGRHVLATDVGGLREQLADEPNALCPPTATGIAVGLRQLLDQRRHNRPEPRPIQARWQAALVALLGDLRQVAGK